MTLQELYKVAAIPYQHQLTQLSSSVLAKRRGLIERASRNTALKSKYIDLPEHAGLKSHARDNTGTPMKYRDGTNMTKLERLQDKIRNAKSEYNTASVEKQKINQQRQAFQNEKATPPFQKSSEVHNMNLTDFGFHKCAATKGIPSFAPQPSRKPATDLGSFIANKATSNPLTGANELLRQPGAALKAQLKVPVPSGSIYKSPAGMKSPSLMARLLPDGVRNVLKRFVR